MIKRLLVMVTAVTALLLAAGLTVAPAAYAEGECSGSFVDYRKSSVIKCTANYSWIDRNTDSQPTALHLKGCSGNPDIALDRWDGAWWRLVGTKRFYCLHTDGGWKEWGDLPAGEYRFRIADPRSDDGLLDVAYWHAGW